MFTTVKPPITGSTHPATTSRLRLTRAITMIATSTASFTETLALFDLVAERILQAD